MKHDAKNTPLYEVLHDLLLKIFVKLESARPERRAVRMCTH